MHKDPPSVLHHLDEIDPVVFNHGLIHGGHLHAGDGRYELHGNLGDSSHPFGYSECFSEYTQSGRRDMRARRSMRISSDVGRPTNHQPL